MSNALDLALFGAFIVLTIALICFRRFHQYETFVKSDELGPSAWGLYSAPNTEKTAVANTPHGRKPR